MRQGVPVGTQGVFCLFFLYSPFGDGPLLAAASSAGSSAGDALMKDLKGF